MKRVSNVRTEACEQRTHVASQLLFDKRIAAYKRVSEVLATYSELYRLTAS